MVVILATFVICCSYDVLRRESGMKTLTLLVQKFVS